MAREQLARALATRGGHTRLLSLCAGDGRDTLPVLAEHESDVDATLVELDGDLADAARRDAAARGLAVDVRTGDAGLAATWTDVVPVDVLMLCGLFGNVRDDDVRRTVRALPLLLTAEGTVIWTRGRAVPDDPAEVAGDPAAWVRGLFGEPGWEERAFVRPDDAGFRVGVHTWHGISAGLVPVRLFSFV